MQHRIVLTAETPLSFRSGRNPSQSSTLDYIPGTSIIGALARTHQMLGGGPDEFAAFFLHERIRFSNCYPSSFESSDLQGETDPVLPLPMTARSCKRFRGFRFGANAERKRRQGVTDALIPLALFAMSGEQRAELLEPLDRCNCAAPGHALDRIEGFFRRGSQEHHYGQPDVKKGIRTRTGINYETGTAQSAILYSRQVIQARATFWGRWWIDDDLAPSFEAFLNEADERGLLRVGNNRTRGFGRFRLELNPQAIPDEPPAVIGERVEAFTRRFKQAATTAGVEAPAPLYVPVLLTSDAILTDSLLRARLRLDASDLEAVGIANATLVYHTAGVRQVQGWSTLWGLPKADDWAIAMGSVFLFALADDSEATMTALLRWQDKGVGLRRSEGFGSLSIAHPLHHELAGEYR
ncbi:MAG: hypothetical protein HC884_16125 [Chloroflexaceae bacterium]|nr:hypothetical protein [Chloroflexaceae bacterium]